MKNLITVISLLIGFIANAQDIHFSQTAETPLLVNPGATGVYGGWERVQLNQRNQWLGATTQFMTSSLACDVNFFKTERNDRAHLGLGMFFYNDIGGDSKFGTQSGSLSVSGILPFSGRGHVLSAGIQTGFGMRSLDLNRVFFENQINGNSFDVSIPSGEVAGRMNFNYVDVSTGVFYQYDSEQASFRRNENVKFQAGGAIYHANKPSFKYNGVAFDKLAPKYVFMSTFSKDIPASDWAYDLSVVQFFQGAHRETILGGMGRYRFSSGSKITGFNREAYAGFGLYMRYKDALIPRFLVDWKGFRFGLSYDVTISKLNRAYKGGSVEFSISYTNLKYALLKRRRN
jgi:type IX secretion system PorP/SprF family membrane protein